MDGLVFGLMPETMRRLLAQLRGATIEDMRGAGLISAALGLLIVFMVVYAPRLW